MNRCAFSIVVVLLASCAAAEGEADRADTEKGAAPAVVWEVSDGLATPESVYYDSGSDSIFVSNIGEGGPKGKDGDGYISKLDTDGKVVKQKWATGLNAPKGIRVCEGTLWVADIDRLVGIDPETGEISKEVDATSGATFLNDVACGADGAVYVSDTFNTRIFRYADGELSLFVESDLECPNGLLVHGDRLIVAAWGRDPAADFSTKVPGRLLAVDLKTKVIKALTDGPVGNLDGLEADGQGGFYVTDWIAGKVLQVSAEGDVNLVSQLTKGTADLAFLPEKKLLVVPRMMDNKATALNLNK